MTSDEKLVIEEANKLLEESLGSVPVSTADKLVAQALGLLRAIIIVDNN